MEYKYELHCHTKEVSRCGKISVEELINKYRNAGYAGIVLTDHYSPMTFNPDEHFNKRKAISHYLKAYNIAKKYSDENFTVLLGMELRFYGTLNDYLIYGVNEKLLYRLPFLLPLNIKKASKLLHKAGCLLIQAHPFRRSIKRADPVYVDGVEVFNGKNSAAINEKAVKWAEQEKFPIRTSGSDCHDDSNLALGGIITEEPIKNNDDLIRILKSGKYKLISSDDI